MVKRVIKNLVVTSNKIFKINKSEIHKLVSQLQNELNFEIKSFSINIVTSEEIIPINKTYLKHNYSTDIITFNYSGENYTLEGEIFISLGDAFVNSKKYRVSLDKEMVRLIIHGFLHLMGFDDKDINDRSIMKKEENKLVNKFHNTLNKIVLKYDS